MTSPREISESPISAEVGEILDALTAQDKAIDTLWASGKFVLQSPELPEVYLLRQSSLYYSAPNQINIIGRKYTKAVLELTANADDFLLVLPTEQRYYEGLEEANVASLPCVRVSPAQILREMFFFRPWQPEEARAAREVEALEADTKRIEMPVGTDCVREVTLRVNPWRIVGMRILGGDGVVLAEISRTDYVQKGGIWFPQRVEANFPLENAFMRFEVAGFDVNVPLDRADFDLSRQRDAVVGKGYQRMTWRKQP